MNFKKLSIFTPYGATYTFKNGTDFSANEFAITFSFIAMSDGERKVATFFIKNVAGYSIIPDEGPIAKMAGLASQYDARREYK